MAPSAGHQSKMDVDKETHKQLRDNRSGSNSAHRFFSHPLEHEPQTHSTSNLSTGASWTSYRIGVTSKIMHCTELLFLLQNLFWAGNFHVTALLSITPESATKPIWAHQDVQFYYYPASGVIPNFPVLFIGNSYDLAAVESTSSSLSRGEWWRGKGEAYVPWKTMRQARGLQEKNKQGREELDGRVAFSPSSHVPQQTPI